MGIALTQNSRSSMTWLPDHIRTIIEREYPPIPMILVNGQITRIGRISLDRIKNEIEKEL